MITEEQYEELKGLVFFLNWQMIICHIVNPRDVGYADVFLHPGRIVHTIVLDLNQENVTVFIKN